ncbi:hypothetical protein V6N12_026525 [Hibiscus sabdariffa]
MESGPSTDLIQNQIHSCLNLCNPLRQQPHVLTLRFAPDAKPRRFKTPNPFFLKEKEIPHPLTILPLGFNYSLLSSLIDSESHASLYHTPRFQLQSSEDYPSEYKLFISKRSPKILGSGLSLWLLGLFDQLSFMSDLDVQIPTAFDPFADANAEDSGAGSKEYVHIRIQQRNGRKSLTTVQGLKKEFSYNKILKDLKKEFCCNGTVVQDPELGQVIQLQGDQRKNVSTFLVQAGIVKKDNIKIHGF